MPNDEHDVYVHRYRPGPPVDRTVEIGMGGVNVDLAADGTVVGVEVLGAQSVEVDGKLLAPSPPDRDLLANLVHDAWHSDFAGAAGKHYLVADALLARYDIRERGETQTEPDGAAQIVAERHRVVTAKGYDAAHDDQHVHGELLAAARCYFNQGLTYFAEFTSAYGIDAYSMYDQNWPWWKVDEPAGWKPSSSPVRNLVKAGQLIAAEIDRLKRAKRGDLS